MTEINVMEFLNQACQNAQEKLGSNDKAQTDLTDSIRQPFDMVLAYSESAKGVLTVVLTSLVYKINYPQQDIRKHQTSIEDGYSGRTFDSKNITPFLKAQKFPAMAESGWLTRSLEQKVPYDKDYTGAIRPAELKTAFLNTIDLIQKNQHLTKILDYLLQKLMGQRKAPEIDLAKPHNLPISTIISLLTKQFNAKYNADGASRLPVLALYAAYQCMISEVKRFSGKQLLSLENHTSADSRSGRIGDIDITDEQGKAFEAVEVKHGIPITVQLVKDAFEKFKTTQVNRYYLLSTADINENEKAELEKEIERIKNIHGCHVIANGLISSLKYYLRLLEDTSKFIDFYVNLLETDSTLKYEHKSTWNKIISDM